MTFPLNPFVIAFQRLKASYPKKWLHINLNMNRTSFFPKQLKFSFTLSISLILAMCNEAEREQGTWSLEILVKFVTEATEVAY